MSSVAALIKEVDHSLQLESCEYDRCFNFNGSEREAGRLLELLLLSVDTLLPSSVLPFIIDVFVVQAP